MRTLNDTNWAVVTGALSSGKTSVVLELARRGYAVSPEVARALIEEKLGQGMTIEQVRADPVGLQREILRRSVAREEALDTGKLVFLDRGLPGALGYWRLGRGDMTEAVDACRARRYRAVFIMARLPLVNDAVRDEDERTAAALDRMMDEDYRMLGYAPVHVPVMPVERRVDFILEKLGPDAG